MTEECKHGKDAEVVVTSDGDMVCLYCCEDNAVKYKLNLLKEKIDAEITYMEHFFHSNDKKPCVHAMDIQNRIDRIFKEMMK